VCLHSDLHPFLLSLPPGGESVLGSLPVPENPEPEAACSGQEGDVRGQSENRD